MQVAEDISIFFLIFFYSTKKKNIYILVPPHLTWRRKPPTKCYKAVHVQLKFLKPMAEMNCF